MTNRRTRKSPLIVIVIGSLSALICLASCGSRKQEEPPAATSPHGAQAPSPAPKPAAYRSAAEIRKSWPRFRGPGGLGIAGSGNAPSTWNGRTREGILWKMPVPLKGASSPVVWGQRVFLTGADKEKREVYCFDADSGKLLWTRPVGDKTDGEPPDVWEDGGYAASTCATDGRRVYAIFASGDLVCFDFEGNSVWTQKLGPFENSYGHAASLAMYRDRLLIQVDQALADEGESRSRLMALSAATGRKIWEAARPVRDSWASPIVIRAAERDQIVTCAEPWVISYDAATGKEIWRVNCLSGDVAPSPVFAGGLVFVTMESDKLAAIRPTGTGDVTKTHIAWTVQDGDFPGICSPVCDGKYLYLLSSSGFLSSWEVQSGKKVWEQDLELSFVASPTLAGNRIYLIGDDGAGVVARVGAKYEELSRPTLGDYVSASPAFLNGRIYIRGEKHLFCIGSANK